MPNLELAVVHMDQLAVYDCTIVRNIKLLSQNLTDPTSRRILLHTIAQLKEIISEVDMLRASLRMSPVPYGLVHDLLNGMDADARLSSVVAMPVSRKAAVMM